MTTLRTAAQQALEALEVLDRVVLSRHAQEAITALRAALAEYDKDRVKVEEMKANWALQCKLAEETQERDKQQREYEEQRLAALAEPVQETGVKLKPVFYAPRMLDDEEVEDIIKRNAAITESILDIDRKEPQPGMVNLDAFRAFHFNDPPKGGFVGEIEMLKWLVRNRDGDYWKAKYGVQEPPCAPSECPNCASLQDQNTELDRKLAEMERKPMNEFDALRLVTESIGHLQSAGPVEGLIGIIRAVERAHGIT